MKPVTPRLLCAMARAEFAPTIDDGEWSDRIKRRLAAQSFPSVYPHQLTSAMHRVEVVLAKEGIGRRKEGT